MALIYEPAGRAREFAPLACNVYRGCAHGCVYCYAPSATRKDRADFLLPQERPNFLKTLAKEAAAWNGPRPQVLLSFTCDPFQPLEETAKVTHSTISILHSYGFGVATLTKGGSRALKALPLFRHGDAFASTLTFLDDADSLRWEPGAALPQDRINTLKTFHGRGIPTWVSLEPCIAPFQSLAIIQETYQFVDLYKVGKLNYHPAGKLVDWADYTARAVKLLTRLGRSYIVKDDLAQFVPSGLPQKNVR